jgi:hypothetical protein
LALVALGVAWKLFPLAIPVLNLEVTMSRREALAQGEELAAARKLAPEGARSAVRFSHDGTGAELHRARRRREERVRCARQE